MYSTNVFCKTVNYLFIFALYVIIQPKTFLLNTKIIERQHTNMKISKYTKLIIINKIIVIIYTITKLFTLSKKTREVEL